MFSRERANWVLASVYRDGLARTKSILVSQVSSGDLTARKLLSAIGLCEAGVEKSSSQKNETLSPRIFAEQIQQVLEARRASLLVDRLVTAVLHGDMTIREAENHLL